MLKIFYAFEEIYQFKIVFLSYNARFNNKFYNGKKLDYHEDNNRV